MGTHIALVSVYHDGEVRKRVSELVYTGPANWKFAPIDPDARERWAKETADPARVEKHLKDTGDWDHFAKTPLKAPAPPIPEVAWERFKHDSRGL